MYIYQNNKKRNAFTFSIFGSNLDFYKKMKREKESKRKANLGYRKFELGKHFGMLRIIKVTEQVNKNKANEERKLI